MDDRPGLPLTVSFSGGKDSLAVLELARLAMEGRARARGGAAGSAGAAVPAGAADRPAILFSNTGLEFPETVEHVRAVAKRYGMRLLERDAGGAFWENLPAFGLPAKDFRWCCKVCKLAPMAGLLAENYPGGVLTVEGRRRRESFARLGLRLVEESPFVPGQTNIEPIRDWTALAVWLYIRWRRLAYNPLYDEDFERIGCWLCPATLESEFETLRRTHPGLHSRWTASLSREGGRLGLDEKALSAGLWRWRSLPPKMKGLAPRAGPGAPPPAAEASPVLRAASGISPCATGGYTIDAVLSLPRPAPMERAANLLETVGDVRFSPDMGVAIVRRNGFSAKLFGSGQLVVTGPTPAGVRSLLRDVAGAILRAAQCSRCGICARACARRAVSVGEWPEVDASRCDRCGACARSCVLVRYADRLVAGLGRASAAP